LQKWLDTHVFFGNDRAGGGRNESEGEGRERTVAFHFSKNKQKRSLTPGKPKERANHSPRTKRTPAVRGDESQEGRGLADVPLTHIDLYDLDSRAGLS